jgi:hypothetical protein
MADPTPSLLSRLVIAIQTFWQVLVDPRFAAAAADLRTSGSAALSGGAGPEPALLREAEPNAALQLLGLLQQDGRFIDFLQEDVRAYSDTEIGAAARVVHEGCKRTLKEHFTIEPVRAEPEGTLVTLEEGFDPSAVRLTGKVLGRPPFSGSLTHKGWRITGVRLPKVAAGHDLAVLAPAEVEL